MSPGFVKGLLVSIIVFGFETLLLAVYFLFRRDSRTVAAKYFVRGGVTVAVFSVAFLLFKQGFFLDDFSLFLLFVGYAGVSMAIEGLFARNLKTLVSPKPLTREHWQKTRTPKRQFVFIMSLAFGWILVTPAIVFTIVAPEVLPVYWWPILIVALSLVGFVFALRYWNSNEKRFGSETQSSPQ
jgi:hypothetical protein